MGQEINVWEKAQAWTRWERIDRYGLGMLWGRRNGKAVRSVREMSVKGKR